ncbi:uncharacterized protein LOC141613371 [Silene latifolia]|uniref:uncharacterized protein LOC141613371 n=1 Tax=Silene latifolia TaxID=37657 RepID=UPI003D779193
MPPLLAKPEQGEPLFLYLSVTEAEVSVVLVKEKEGIQHPLYYISKSLLPAETRYTSFEKLVLALVTASYKLRPYFESHTIHVVTNYPLKTIMRKPELSGRMTKWSVHLSGYDLQFEPRTAIKSQALADFVSDFCPATHVEAEKGMLTLLGDQESGVWTLYIDGASNARGAGVGLVLRSLKGDMMVQVDRCEFKATNNEAEYEALILGMQMAQGLKVRNLRVFSNSLLVVPRDQNVKAGALATLGATFQPAELSNIPITHVLTPTIQKESGQDLPGEAVHVWHVRRERVLISDKGPCLRCLSKMEADTVFHDVHSEECGNYAGGQSLSNKILRHGYFWPTMRADAVNHAKRCDSCQKAAPAIYQPVQPMHPIISPWPFMMWGMDIVGKLPRAPGNRVYMLVMTDYFSKWIEAEAMTEVKEHNTEGFCSRWNITLRKSAPRYPQTNGQAESGNKIIVENLRKRLEELGGKWADELPLVLWSDRTTPKVATGQTPFSLVYGAEAVIPSEVMVPTHRYGCQTTEQNQVEVASSLHTVHELRESAYIRMASYKQSVARTYNKNVKVRTLAVGDLVLRRVFENTKITRQANSPTSGKEHIRSKALSRMGHTG